MNSFAFQNPTKIIFGQGTVRQLGKEAAAYGNKALLVYGGGSIKKTGLYDQVLSQLKEHGIEAFELAGIEPNPRLSTVHKGIDICRKNGIGFVLAVGGGSVLDASKAIALGVPYEGDVWDFYEHKATAKDALPLGTVLTLSATGSEMNSASVITNWEQNRKLGYLSVHAFPRFSILDPTLTYTVPKDQTAYGAVDMMTHVFEQYFNHTPDTPLQERLCESILKTIVENAKLAQEKPDDYAARANLMLCGTYALNGGMISVGMDQDWASHDIEHELSAIYDIAHGAGLSIVYPNWMKYVYRERIERFVQFAVRVWDIDPSGKSDEDVALEGIQATRDFFRSLGAPSTLAEVGIGEDRIEEMAAKAVGFGPLGHFKKLEQADVAAIYRLSL
ncbi:iron-containing alcohol dehydrogenase [Cohnella thailandensis]|uniref:Iron-containing alcohol dehydrogenase n=1 Tax=Cohnella thailandensis TaxID=557557 RepID=A0A841T004_9BACL|nr:iron-containing alcohol dehydrogenase [Cohnella thailandensis]MBB6635207.1 iron-containing alcohol dehydrogenase [Cohnella thailandensis]MBP1974327.1 alcohol dehydrogenase YqhD (iron-dependent ADH family) [Cohnella thailandensis]